MSDSQAPSSAKVTAEALAVAQPLVTWLVRSGVGYTEFAAALKPVFLAQAEAEVFEHFRSLARDRIAILISHRFSTVRMADQIAVIDDGRIA